MLTLFKLYIMPCLGWSCRVHLNHIIIYQGSKSEETKTSRTTKHTTEDVFCSFLEPMSNCILELLVPNHRTCNIVIYVNIVYLNRKNCYLKA